MSAQVGDASAATPEQGDTSAAALGQTDGSAGLDDSPGVDDSASLEESASFEDSAARQAASKRAELTAAAQARWVDALTDLGGRNTLLYYKDRRAGTLDLADADPAELDRFLRTGSSRITRLFRDVDIRADAIRRAQAIYRRASELLEERGIKVGYLATGLASWDELFLEPAAPVLLRSLTITPTRARHDDFDLLLDEEDEVNPVLLHKLASVFGAATEEIGNRPTEQAADLLRSAAFGADVPGFRILDRQVIGTFTYAKLPMVRDLQGAAELLDESDVVAAIAGDPDAQELLAAEGDGDHALDSPEDDYSVLDADSSQRSAIDAVLSGRSLVIHGPPGTGKSQTIANLIAGLVARGRKVLFVAEKRAAIDAVLSRLKGADLSGPVLDIHEGTKDRLRIARDLGDTLDEAQRTIAPDVGSLHRRLRDRQRKLGTHAAALHAKHQPWGLSAWEVQAALLGIPAEARTQLRIKSPQRISKDLADQLRDELREFAHLGGFTFRPAQSPWFGATLRSPQQAKQACDLVTKLNQELPALTRQVELACAQTGLTVPAAATEEAARMRLFVGVETTLRRLGPAVYGAEPARLAASLTGGAGLGFRERRALRKQAQQLAAAAGQPGADPRSAAAPNAEPPQAELAAWLQAAASELVTWQQLRTDNGMPRLPACWPGLAAAQAGCERQLAGLRTFVAVPEDPAPVVAVLAADQDTAWRLPRLYELGSHLDDVGLGPLLDELAHHEADPDQAAATFDDAWYSSVLDQIRMRDPGYDAHRGDQLDEIASDFRTNDVQHLAANQGRVRRAWAQALAVACDRHPLQARVIRKQAALRRGHLPLRRLLDQTGDVLFAIKPCWAMSPLMVSQVLPASRLFDVVIFDEASQIVPADAIPSIMRGHQIVVAGDDRQLPPTNFFRQVGDADEDVADEDESLVSFDAGFESVLDALRPLLPTAPLTWHYRSRDERLVAFSNSRIYGGALTTFPGVLRQDCLRHVVVSQGPEPGQEVSVNAEVRKVVDLVLEHARTRPAESLGVIALGIRHAERIDTELRGVLSELPEGSEGIEEFFAEDVPEPFFVKNLERVQGDERDAIILSIGYGKHRDGRMRYQWGPLLRDGGERRLNVAATRAKHRLTLVSSFAGHEVDPDRVTKAGAKLLADYLDYASSGGTAQPVSGAAELDSFEADVRDRLADCGITVVPQYGIGGYRVDFAAAHPGDSSRMLLAIEADGASYSGSGSVRDRDRLRGEHLQRLGWRYHRLWSTSWFQDPQAELAKVQAAYERAVAEADDQMAEERLAEERLAEERLAEERLAEERLADDELAEEQLANGQLAQDPLAQERPSEEQLANGQLAQDPLARQRPSEEQLADDVVPEDVVPEDVVPDDVRTDDLVPDDQVPGERVPDDQVPGVAAPAGAADLGALLEAAEHQRQDDEDDDEGEDPQQAPTRPAPSPHWLLPP